MPERTFSITGFLPFFLVIILLVPSCLDQKGRNQYIGNWQYVQTVTSGDLTYTTTRTLQLTKNSYEEVYLIQRQESGAVAGITGTRGNLSLTHSDMVFELKELGTCARDTLDACTSQVLWYGEGSQYWTDNVQYFGLVIKGEFQAEEMTLTLRRDLNNDGDTDDSGENIVFNRI